VVEDEFGLDADLGVEAVAGQAGQLVLEDLAGCDVEEGSVGVEGVAEDDRGAQLPRDQTQCREVGAYAEVLVAGRPAGQGKAVRRVHVDIGGEDVGAHVGAVVRDLVEEVGGAVQLALQPSREVGKREGNSVARVRLDEVAQVREGDCLPGAPTGFGEGRVTAVCRAGVVDRHYTTSSS